MSSRTLTRAALVVALVVTGTVATTVPAGAAPAYRTRTLHFLVHVGPDRATACDVVGDLCTPRTASSTHEVPAILTTNGFGGSKADQQPFAAQYAAHGYAVLSYSGLGFGGSGCPITLDDPDFDGVAGSQLVSYLGGAPGIAFADAAHTQPVARLDVVVHDATDHAGRARTYDPRVGMWGGSYGGQVQFAVAGVDVASLQHASVSTYYRRITVPTLLVQGEVDTLFDLNEAAATYAALKAQGTPVSLLWRYDGHSGGTPSAAGAAYEATRISTWFAHYLKDQPVGTGPAFAYYRDWDGGVGVAARYPIGTADSWYLSGSDLVTDRRAVTAGAQSFVTPPAGVPTTLGNPDALGSLAPTSLDLPDVDVPGTFARWQSGVLTAPVTVVGSPTLDVTVAAPVAATAQSTGPAGRLVLVAKVYDVAPDSTAAPINGLVAPVRIPDVTEPAHVTLPAFAHRFGPGHRLAVVLAGGDVNHRAGLVAQPVTVSTAPGSTQRLTLPVVASS